MKTGSVLLAIAVVAIVAISSFVAFEFTRSPVGQTTSSTATCLSIAGGTVNRSQTITTSFGPVTEYQIPGPDRYPGAVTIGPDGSVWFAEWEVPGVAHLFPHNGTLVEYAWKGYPKPSPRLFCQPPANVSGIAFWEGKVWAADEFRSAIVGTNPSDGSSTLLNTTSKSQPYWLSVGPDGNLWFTSDTNPAYLGRVFPNMTVSLISLSGMGTDNPLQLKFVNSSLGFISAINLANDPKTHACVCDGRIYAFNPSKTSGEISPTIVGGNYTLILPTSVSFSNNRIWVAQHGTSTVASYDFQTATWTNYPTSRVPWTNATLPLAMEATGDRVWFNEHYANKMAFIDPGRGTLTEISASNPPAASSDGIQNDEFITLQGGGLWFTSLSGNYVGIIDGSFAPGFQVTDAGTGKASFRPGGISHFSLNVSGTWTQTLNVSISDSESYSSIPDHIHVTPSSASIPTGNSTYMLGLEVTTDPSIKPGNYTVAVTVTEGEVQQTAYLFLTIG